MGVWKPELIDKAFADAALDPSLWVKALDIVTSLTGSQGAILVPAEGEGLRNIHLSELMVGAIESYFRDGWHLRDERTLGIDTMMRHGVVDDLDISSFDRIKQHPYYQEFLAPQGLRWFAGIRVASGEDVWCLSIQRTINQGPFSEAEKRQFAKLSERLSASAALARALGAATAAGALQAFEVSGKAAVLINRHGEAFRINKSAEKLLHGDVRIERRRLVASDPGAKAALNRSLHALMWQRANGGVSGPPPFPDTPERHTFSFSRYT